MHIGPALPLRRRPLSQYPREGDAIVYVDGQLARQRRTEVGLERVDCYPAFPRQMDVVRRVGSPQGSRW